MELFHFESKAVDFDEYAGTYIRIELTRNDVIVTM